MINTILPDGLPGVLGSLSNSLRLRFANLDVGRETHLSHARTDVLSCSVSVTHSSPLCVDLRCSKQTYFPPGCMNGPQALLRSTVTDLLQE